MVLGVKIQNPGTLNISQLALLALKEFGQREHTKPYPPAQIIINAKEREKLPPQVSINNIPLVGDPELEPGYVRVCTCDIEGLDD